ncbi:MAG: ATP-binding cassette domain-containing protein [Geminicoccaceae bacterium]
MLAYAQARMSKAELLAEHSHVLGLRDINVDMQAGEITVIMGLSGSGKSTLIRHLNRLKSSRPQGESWWMATT